MRRGSVPWPLPLFSLVMATGIVAVAVRTEGVGALPEPLLWLNVAFYAGLRAAFLARLALFPRAHVDDLRTHRRAMGYFTLLAGATLLQVPGSPPLIHALRPFVAGLTLLLWGTATWWIPRLVLFGIWRYAIERRPLAFEVGLRGLVFPLGLYTVATRATAAALHLPPLATIASGFVWVAVVAWAATMLDLLLAALRRAR